MRALLRTKSVADIVAGLEGGGSGLKRTLGTFDLVMLGIGVACAYVSITGWKTLKALRRPRV